MDNDILKELNPIITTGKATLYALAAFGDKNAKALLEELNFEDKDNFYKSKAYNDLIFACLNSLPETQFKLMNSIISMDAKANHVVDIGCGYTTRGLMCAKKGISYVGVDFPEITGAMNKATTKILPFEQKMKIRYVSCDITNYDLLESAVNGLKGVFCITCESLFRYLSDNELEAFLKTIKKFMQKHDSFLYTPDMEVPAIVDVALNILVKDDWDLKIRVREIKREVNRQKNSALSSNSLMEKSTEEKLAFTKDHGFKVERIPISANLENTLSLQSLGINIDDGFKKACRDICVWKLTLDNTKNGIIIEKTEKNFFDTQVNMEEDWLVIKVSGRVDTITSPDLLAVYNKNKDKCEKVKFDFKDVTYVSSAGIRVLLMAYKDRGGKKKFTVVNVSYSVREIFETTGIDEAFLD